MAQKIRIAKEPTVAGMAVRGAFRFLSGRPLYDGENRTDATWTHRGTESYGIHRASWWHYQTKTLRVGVRVGTAASAVGVGYGLLTAPEMTVSGLHNGAVGVGTLAAGAVSYKATDKALAYRHDHDYVMPLHRVLVKALDLPRGTRPRHYLDVPRDFHTITGDTIKVVVPVGKELSGDVRKLVEVACREKLAMQETRFSWHTSGADRYVVATQLPRPPERAEFAEDYVRAAVESASPDTPVIGISHTGKVVAHSIDSDAPHMLFVMGTNSGKSVMLRSISAQLMHHGAEIIMLDYKQGSQAYMRRIKGIRYAREISAIHKALVEFGEEAAERRTLTAKWIDEGGDPDGKEGNPYITHRLCLFFEEINSTRKELKKYWKRVRDKKTDDEESPAIAAFEAALNMGRSEKVHVFAVGQDGREPEIGPRINYGVKVFAKYDKKTWNLLADAGTPPKTSSTRGRVQVVYHGETTETQGLWFTSNEAYEWATTGIGRTASAPDPAFPEAEIARPLPREELSAPDAPQDASHAHAHTSGTHPLPGDRAAEPHAPGREREQPPADGELPPNVVPINRRPAAAQTPEPEPVELVNMRQASQDKGRGIIPMNHEAIRRAKADDPEFPDPEGKIKGNGVWKPETLQAWHRNRVRTANK